MPIPIEVFSLADVMAKSDAARAARQQAQMNEMKMREYQQSINDQRTLGSLYGGMKQVPANITETIPGQAAVLSPGTGAGYESPPTDEGSILQEATPDIVNTSPNPENTPPGRLNNQSQQLRAILQSGTDPSGNRLPGNILAKISAEADAIDEKLYQYQMKINNQGRGEYYTPVYDDKGRLLSFNNRSGQVALPNLPFVAGKFSPKLQGDIEASKEHGKLTAKDIADAGRSADASGNIKDAVEILDRGIYAGSLSEMRKGFAKFTPGMDKKKAANTEEFIAYIGNVVIPRMKDLGGSDTVEELKYMRMITGGEISMESAAIRNILLTAEKKIKIRQERLRKQAEGVGLGGKYGATIPKPSPKSPTSDDEHNAKMKAAGVPGY